MPPSRAGEGLSTGTPWGGGHSSFFLFSRDPSGLGGVLIVGWAVHWEQQLFLFHSPVFAAILMKPWGLGHGEERGGFVLPLGECSV